MHENRCCSSVWFAGVLSVRSHGKYGLSDGGRYSLLFLFWFVHSVSEKKGGILGIGMDQDGREDARDARLIRVGRRRTDALRPPGRCTLLMLIAVASFVGRL